MKDTNGKPHLTADLFKTCNTDFGLISEAKVLSLMHFDCLKLISQYNSRKVVRGGSRHRQVEGKHQNSVETGLCKELQLACERCDETQRRLRMQHARWMRIERDSDRSHVARLRSGDHLVDDHAMRAVHTIEVANRNNAGAKTRGYLVYMAEYLHQAISNPSRNPS